MAVALDCTLYVSYVLKITLQHLTISINKTTVSLFLQTNNKYLCIYGVGFTSQYALGNGECHVWQWLTFYYFYISTSTRPLFISK